MGSEKGIICSYQIFFANTNDCTSGSKNDVISGFKEEKKLLKRNKNKRLMMSAWNMDKGSRSPAALDQIFDAPVGTPESDEADLMGLLIDEYEKKHYPIEAPDPIDAVKIRMKDAFKAKRPD